MENQKAVQNSKSLPQLQTISNSITATALMENKFSEIVKSVGMSAKELIDRPPLAMLKKIDGMDLKLEMFLAAEIKKLVDMVNVNDNLNIQQYQIPIIAQQFIENYPVESLEDFVLCFKRGSAGFYGTIYRLDAATLSDWMEKYLQEKYTYVEAKVKEEQAAGIESNSLNYDEFKKRAPAIFAKEKTNQNDNDFQVYKLNNPRNTEEGRSLINEHINKVNAARRKFFLERKPDASEEEIEAYLLKFKAI